MRVVIADDDDAVREAVDAVLVDAGHEVVGAVSDGRAVVAAVRDREPDGVVLDLSMPVVDGISALRLLRDASPSLRIVVYTAFDDPDVAAELRAAGASAVVAKSADPLELLDALDDDVQGG